MTKQKKQIKIKDKSAYIHTAKLAAVIIAAFIAALMFRRSAGIIAMVPISITLCAAAAFIDISPKIKLTVFGLMVFAINTIEQKDMKVTLMFTALCLLTCILFEISARLLKKKKTLGITSIVISAVLCIGLSVVFVGNPISAISAKNNLDEYTQEKYPNSENAALGEFEFSDIYYNYMSRSFETEAKSNKYPTETAVISFDGNKVSDSFKGIMEQKLAEPYVLDITALLRKYFPDDNFSVTFDKISAMPDEKIFAAESGSFGGNVVFEINLGGVQTPNAMVEKSEHYIEVIEGAGRDYSKIIFKSGISPWVRRCIIVGKNRPVGFNNFLITHVPAGASNNFNNYFTAMITPN